MNYKKLFWFFILGLGFLFWWFSIVSANGNAPSYEINFAKKITGKGSESVYTIEGINSEHTLRENIECLFYPSSSIIQWCGTTSSGYLWNLIRYFAFALIFIFIVYAAVDLLLKSDKKESFKEAANNLLYILIGATIVFLTTRLFGKVLILQNIQGTEWFASELIKPSGIFFVVLSFLKSLAFILAVIMIVVTWFRVMAAGDAEKGKTLSKGVLNIIAALVGIKVIDFVYLLASQQNFAQNAGAFIIQIMKFMGYVSGIAIVTMVIVAGYLFVVDGGSGKNFQKAKGILINILIAMVALFFLLFLIYQIFAEFAG